MSPAFEAWARVLVLLVPVVVESIEGLAGLVASIRASVGLSATEQAELIARLRASLAAQVAAVEAVPVWTPLKPIDLGEPPQND